LTLPLCAVLYATAFALVSGVPLEVKFRPQLPIRV
jgi:hypothetical protein